MARLGKRAAALAIMGAIIAVLLTLCTPRSVSRRSAVDPSRTPATATKP
jgi:hypothetical protein